MSELLPTISGSSSAVPHHLVFAGGDGWVWAKEVLTEFSAMRSFVSGDGRQRILADYWYSATERRVHGVVTFGRQAEGMPGVVHGGAISGVFDEGVGLLSWYLGVPVATRELVVRYQQFIPIDCTVVLQGELLAPDGWIVNGHAELRGLEGTLHATMEASFVELEPAAVEQFARANQSRAVAEELA